MAAGGTINQRIIPLEEGWTDEIKTKVGHLQTLRNAAWKQDSHSHLHS
jgi:hypothetical protein